MNVLQVISSFPPAYAYGGPAESSYRVSKALAERGWDVTVFTTDAKDATSRVEFQNPTRMDGLDVYRFRNVSNTLSYDANLPVAPGMAAAMRSRLREFDLVHLHEFRTVQAVFTHHYAEKFDVPYVIHPRGTVPYLGKSRQKWLFDQMFGESLLTDADRIIETSEFASGQYDDVFPELDHSTVVHLPNGIDWNVYADLPPDGQFRQRHSIDPERPLVMFLGRIHEDKRLDLLVESFERVRTEFPDALLAIVGPDNGFLDELRERIRQLGLTDAVLFTGPAYEDRKLAAFVDADLFVLSSRYESFGNVAVEAMACGTPTVVTDRCGVANWVDEDAITVVDLDAEALAGALCELLADPERRTRLGARAREHARTFDWSEIATRLEDIYDDVVPEGVQTGGEVASTVGPDADLG